MQGGLSVLPSEYPPVWRNETLVEDYPGGVVHDPYRWLEDTDSPATRACAPMQALCSVQDCGPMLGCTARGCCNTFGLGSLLPWQCALTCSSTGAVARHALLTRMQRGWVRRREGTRAHELQVLADYACDAIRCSAYAHARLTAASAGVRAVVAAQMNLTQRVLAQCNTRDQFRALFSQIYNYPKFGAPFQRGRAGGVVRCAPGLCGFY